MPSNRKPKLSVTKAKGVHVYKCVFPSCSNFFTSTSNSSVKYCKNHTRYPKSAKPPLLLLASISLLFCVVFTSAEAAETLKGKGVGILIEKTVLKSGKLLYKDITPLDNSITKYSGGFIEKNGDLMRKSSPYQNSYGYYKHDKTFRIFVDPPPVIRNTLPIITIVSQLDEFHIKGQQKVTELRLNNETKPIESIRTYSHTRYIDSTCTNAIITVKDWKTVLPDTINYLRMNCDPKATKITTLGYDIKPLTKHKLAETYDWKLKQWQKEIMEKCTKSRNACTDLKQPTGAGQK